MKNQVITMNYSIVITSLSLLIGTVYCQENSTWTTPPQVQTTSSDQCPPWFFFNATSNQCECFSSPNTDRFIKCTEHGALLKFGYCMTYKEGEGFFVGLCNYFKASIFQNVSTKDNYIVLPDNTSELNDFMCGPLNRKGVMCSQCIDGFGPSVTSTGHTCSNCTDASYGVPLYLFLEFVPITVFYFIVLLFRINVTSAPMVAFVFYCQIGVSTFLIMSNRYLFDTTLTYKFLNTLITFYGIWNLDFFRYIIPPFCVSPNLKPIHISFLYYISAFYPLLLITVSWIFILLHSRNCTLIVWMWSKLKGYILKTNVKYDGKNTMIDVFATFFLLSYAKLVFTCFRITSVRITVNANNFSTENILHVKSDPSMGYFSLEHLPFAVISCVIFLLVILPLPLLLALYPVRAFRELLFKCGLGTRTMAALHIFVEKFYSCYKDGLEGGRDMRSFVSVHFLLRVANYISVEEILVDLSFTVVILLYFASSLLIALVQPYKKTYMNVLDTLIMANLALLSLVLDRYSGNGKNNSNSYIFYEVSGNIFSTIPLFVLTGIILYKILKKVAIHLSCCAKLFYSNKPTIDKENETFTQIIVRSAELPDRFLRPDHYIGEISYRSNEQTQLNRHVTNAYGSMVV